MINETLEALINKESWSPLAEVSVFGLGLLGFILGLTLLINPVELEMQRLAGISCLLNGILVVVYSDTIVPQADQQEEDTNE